MSNDDAGEGTTRTNRSEQEAQRLDLVGALGLAAREGQERELLVGSQHHKLGAKDNACLLLLVVVDLNGGIVGHAEDDDTGLVAGLGGHSLAATVTALTKGVLGALKRWSAMLIQG